MTVVVLSLVFAACDVKKTTKLEIVAFAVTAQYALHDRKKCERGKALVLPMATCTSA